MVFHKAKNFLSKVNRLTVIAIHLLKTAIAKPKYLLLGLWAFKQLWWVDQDLQARAIAALQTPTPNSLPPLDLDTRRKIRQRAIALWWTAKIHPLRPKCLHLSLALYHWLLQQGISPKLEVGWGNNIGHAWITYDGTVLNDSPDVAKTMIPFKKPEAENQLTV